MHRRHLMHTRFTMHARRFREDVNYPCSVACTLFAFLVLKLLAAWIMRDSLYYRCIDNACYVSATDPRKPINYQVPRSGLTFRRTVERNPFVLRMGRLYRFVVSIPVVGFTRADYLNMGWKGAAKERTLWEINRIFIYLWTDWLIDLNIWTEGMSH